MQTEHGHPTACTTRLVAFGFQCPLLFILAKITLLLQRISCNIPRYHPCGLKSVCNSCAMHHAETERRNNGDVEFVIFLCRYDMKWVLHERALSHSAIGFNIDISISYHAEKITNIISFKCPMYIGQVLRRLKELQLEGLVGHMINYPTTQLCHVSRIHLPLATSTVSV